MKEPSKKQQALLDAATKLFSQSGWTAVSVDSICSSAGVSRVTFYKRYPHKHALLQTLLTEHKNRIRSRFEALLEHNCSLPEIAAAIFAMQRESLAGLYSPPMLHDMQCNQNEELAAFFAKMSAEKYDFMRRFFYTLQQRRLVQTDLPTVLIDAFIRQMDTLMQQPELVRHYQDQPQQLLQDTLHLLLHGLTWHADKKTV